MDAKRKSGKNNRVQTYTFIYYQNKVEKHEWISFRSQNLIKNWKNINVIKKKN